MKQFESEHYIFHFNEGSKAEKDIEYISSIQERCFRYICHILRVTPSFKIEYYLCDSPEMVGEIYGDNDPCNGFHVVTDKIYAVYNDEIQCIGFHEDAHLISYTINRPDNPAIREGLAMFFDTKWWKISNMDWTIHYLNNGKYISVDKLLDKETFFSYGCEITYPIMGAFTDWLISTYGTEKYLEMYKSQDPVSAISEIFRKTGKELNDEFVDYVGLFKIDEQTFQPYKK